MEMSILSKYIYYTFFQETPANLFVILFNPPLTPLHNFQRG